MIECQQPRNVKEIAQKVAFLILVWKHGKFFCVIRDLELRANTFPENVFIYIWNHLFAEKYKYSVISNYFYNSSNISVHR